MNKARTNIIVEISGGMVKNVYCGEARVDVTIVDWDTEGCVPGRRNLQKVENRTEAALVYPLETTCPELLENSDTLTVLEAAGEASWL